MFAPMIGTARRNSERVIEPSRSRGSNARRTGLAESDILELGGSLLVCVSMTLRILSINIGRPRIIGRWNGEAVLSGIAKTPVAADMLFVGRTNIDGDGQADLTVHGGPDKAVYVYPSAHWPWWEGEK